MLLSAILLAIFWTVRADLAGIRGHERFADGTPHTIHTTFLTFGGPSPDYRAAVARLCGEVERLELFDRVVGCTDADLRRAENAAFWGAHGAFLESAAGARGYGYWIWKPYLIGRALAAMRDGDVLVYLDAGCTLNAALPPAERRRRFADLVERARAEELLYTFYSLDGGNEERAFNKADLLDRVGALRDPAVTDTLQCQATAIALANSPRTRELARQWLALAVEDGYHLVDDSPSRLPEARAFAEHRHDQAIFSLLVKLHGLFTDPRHGTASTASTASTQTTHVVDLASPDCPFVTARRRSG